MLCQQTGGEHGGPEKRRWRDQFFFVQFAMADELDASAVRGKITLVRTKHI
jgi:hypothetical protein